jgi:DNA adenine methylase
MFYSPLRYPGGKGKLASFMKEVIVDNNILDGIYVEPYAGGAGIALALLFEEYVSRIVINDIDRSIYAFWFSVINHPNEFCKLVYDTPVTVQEWERQKDIQLHKEEANILLLGFSTFYLNRTNRSGIINGGIIGGKKQDGTWTLDVRFNKNELIRRINKIAYYKNRIEVHNLDTLELIQDVISGLPNETLIYFDPPYFNKGQQLYINYYNINDHQNLYTKITGELNHKWILTYDNVQEINELYKDYRPIEYSLNYSAGFKTKATEVMFFNNNVVIPDKHPLFDNI